MVIFNSYVTVYQRIVSRVCRVCQAISSTVAAAAPAAPAAAAAAPTAPTAPAGDTDDGLCVARYLDFLHLCYPLVNIQKTMENHHFLWEIPLYMVIFHSYVSLPEGICHPFNCQFG
jgi:hypothetical protein